MLRFSFKGGEEEEPEKDDGDGEWMPIGGDAGMYSTDQQLERTSTSTARRPTTSPPRGVSAPWGRYPVKVAGSNGTFVHLNLDRGDEESGFTEKRRDNQPLASWSFNVDVMAITNGTPKISNSIRHNGKEFEIGKRLLSSVIDEYAAEDLDHSFAMVAKSRISRILDGFDLADREPIAYLGLQDPRYNIMELAAMKLGRPILLPGYRNALPNTAHILSSAGCKTLFYSKPNRKMCESLKLLVDGLRNFEVPDLQDMISTKAEHYPYIKTWGEVKNGTVLIAHTPGSTGMPKPIHITHEYLSAMDGFGHTPPVEGRIMASTALCTPGSTVFIGTNFYHISGAAFPFCAILQRYTLVFGPPDLLPEGSIVRDIAKSVKLNGMHINWLEAPLAQTTGDWIHKHLPKVLLWQFLGSTKNYALPLLVPPKSHWSYFEFHPTLGPTLEPIDETNDVCEVVIHRHPDPKFWWSTPVLSVSPGIEEYRMRDLLRRCTTLDLRICGNSKGG
ncbi:hypothetical protein G7Y89_g9672 [Cudoniella acicularis]|uniref:AMP-dependent synthetase/ligase domain-containing protein n=1 Tax=Cudoniella acicularis TaxID=354080 RepID=A0A8H4W2D0_9HELO|nr:hypothetical protein G7Y89_g9672 [Cudoniella acicularis]